MHTDASSSSRPFQKQRNSNLLAARRGGSLGGHLECYLQIWYQLRILLAVLTDTQSPLTCTRVHHGTLWNRLANRNKQHPLWEFTNLGSHIRNLDLKSWCSENHSIVQSISVRSTLKRCTMAVFLASYCSCTNSCACLWKEIFFSLSVSSFFFFLC